MYYYHDEDGGGAEDADRYPEGTWLQRRHYHGEISVLFRKRRRTGLRHRIPAWFLYFPCGYLERVPDYVPAGGYPDYSGLEAGVNFPYRLHFMLHGNNDCHLPL